MACMMENVRLQYARITSYLWRKRVCTDERSRRDSEATKRRCRLVQQMRKERLCQLSAGCCYSDDYKNCMIRTLFDKADKFMHENKLKSKMSRESKEQHWNFRVDLCLKSAYNKRWLRKCVSSLYHSVFQRGRITCWECCHPPTDEFQHWSLPRKFCLW